MLLNHINYKMPIYKDCTLGEVLFVGGCTFSILTSVLSIITKLLFGFAWIGLAVAFFFLVPVTRFLLSGLQKIKYGKPYGYYQHLLLKNVSRTSFLNHLLKIPFVQRHGKWSVRREL